MLKKQHVLDEVFFIADYIVAYIAQMAFMRLDLKVVKPIINAELRVMMDEM